MSDTRAQASKATRDATNTAVNEAASAAHRGADTLEHNTRAAGEALRQGGQAAAEVARQAGAAGAETLRRSTGAVAESQRQIAQEAAERLQNVTRTVAQTTRGTVEDMRALMTLPAIAERGLQDLQHGVAGLVEGVVQTNLRAAEELLRLANPSAVIELQQRFVRDYMSAVLEGSAAIVRAVRQTAEQTLPPLEQHLRERQQAFGSNNNNRYQTAAE